MCIEKTVNSLICELTEISRINDEIFTLCVNWDGPAPKAGQFFMVKPKRSINFFGRPLSVFEWQEEKKSVKFLIALRGKGTDELSHIKQGEKIELTGPLGNNWEDFLPANGKKTALVSGGVGIAPIAALCVQKPELELHVYAGFKNSFTNKTEELAILGAASTAKKLVVSAEYGMSTFKGRIVDFFDNDPYVYSAVFACGPEPMLKAVKAKCEKAGIHCFVSLERRMACGIGACLGCTVSTLKGNRRCCVDGPIFNIKEIDFE